MAANKPKLYFQGPNHTADLALFRPAAGGPEVLLIVRGSSVFACPGLPAFPGGFVNAKSTSSPRHELCETFEDAARREFEEETGLSASSDAELQSLGTWQSPWRDPRNDAERQAHAHLFAAWVPEGFGADPQGLDDCEPGKTQWVPVASLAGTLMAFDHGSMLSACCAKLGIPDPGARSWALENLWAALPSPPSFRGPRP